MRLLAIIAIINGAFGLISFFLTMIPLRIDWKKELARRQRRKLVL